MNSGRPLNVVLKDTFVEIRSFFCSLFIFRLFVFLFLTFFIFAAIYLELGVEWIKNVNTILSIIDAGLYTAFIWVIWGFINKLDIKSLYNVFLWTSFIFLIYSEYLLFDCKKTAFKLIPYTIGKK